MKYKFIGKSKLKLSNIGLGCMGMSEWYGPTDDQESIATIKKAYEFGINHFDTADIYGSGHNEKLLAKSLRPFERSSFVLSTKCGFVRNTTGEVTGLNCSPEHIIKSCDESLKRLQTDYIDLFYLHREDPNIPIEESMQGLKYLVEEGKVLNIGICSASPQTIRKAHAIYPLTAVQFEYSLITRDVEVDILPLCKELGIGLVAYSPTGNGFLTGKIKSLDNLASDDIRQVFPRLQNENIEHNLKIVNILENMAAKKHCTTTQVALAWVLAQWEDIIVIPGTKQTKHLEENVRTNDVILSNDELDYLSNNIPFRFAKGTRLPQEFLKLLNNYELPDHLDL